MSHDFLPPTSIGEFPDRRGKELGELSAPLNTAKVLHGKIDMPLTPTFWSPLYGQLTDKFNVGWIVMAQGPPQET